MCGTRSGWVRIDVSRGGFSPTRALVARALLGPRECGFGHTYRL